MNPLQDAAPNLNNRDLAAALFNVATLLRDRQDNPYRIRAYERGARALMGRRGDAVGLLRDGVSPLARRKGVLGERVQRRLQELAQTGKMSTLDDLCADLPPYVGALMALPGVGPRTAQRLHDALGVETPVQLAAAARAGRTRAVYGIGVKREARMAQLSLFEGV